MSFRAMRWLGVFFAALVAAAAACASPAHEHQRAVAAYGRGDVVAAMRTLRPLAQAGHGPSQRMLAFILDRSDAPEEAARLYRDAADQGDAEATAALGELLMVGRGIAKDEKLALAQFSKAAELGHRQSIEVMADAQLRGSLGTAATDPSRTPEALRRAADMGHLPAIAALAQAYRTGNHGIAPDLAQATAWDAKLAELRRQRGLPPLKGKP